jgi:4-diphosphocytidyl-2-C-methyl-D-erythritol kinase
VNSSALNLPSFAKINRSLRVLGKRLDGYHEILTVFQTISLHDQLVLISRRDEIIQLTCNDPNIPRYEGNLVVQAALALRKRSRRLRGADIALLKRIPTKAGLGGASSNAAVALMGLNTLWRTGLQSSDLLEIGSELGADVPFFLRGGLAAGEGTGTRVTSLAEEGKQRLIIVTPRVGVSTRKAYQLLKAGSLTSRKPTSILTSSFADSLLSDCDQWPLHNDFEAVIFEIEPEIERAKQALLEVGARDALLTGSGSSVFGIFDNEERRQHALDTLVIESGWRVFPCSTISRDEYSAAMDSAGVSML